MTSLRAPILGTIAIGIAHPGIQIAVTRVSVVQGVGVWNSTVEYSVEKVEYQWNVECLETAELKLSKYSEYPYVLGTNFEYCRKSRVRSHQSI